MAAAVKIYTREYCGFCTAAISLLRGKGVPFEEIDATGDDKTRAWLAEVTRQSTVPQIFIGGVSIGGFSELRALDQRGELDALLWDAPASSPAASGSDPKR
jgi:glutaredoxin 3